MNITLQTIAILLLTGTLLSCSQQNTADKREIRSCFTDVVLALQTGEASLALGRVDDASFQYFSDLRRHALRSSEETVRSLPPSKKIMVLSIRHLIPAGTIETMSTSALINFFVTNGLFGGVLSPSVPELGAIQIEGHTASAAMIEAGEQIPFTWKFAKEGGEWKMNLTSIYDLTDAAIIQEIRQLGVKEDEYIFEILEAAVGDWVSLTVWKP